MSETPAWYDDLALPVLLASARATYGKAIREDLAAAGCDDVPRSGARVLGAIARDSTVTDIAALVGTSKQAASQLVDTLVARGYLLREADPEDRRRVKLRLTERGVEAAAVVRSAVEDVDAAVEARVGSGAVATMRAAVAAVVELGHPEHFGDHDHHDHDHDHRGGEPDHAHHHHVRGERHNHLARD